MSNKGSYPKYKGIRKKRNYPISVYTSAVNIAFEDNFRSVERYAMD